MMKYLKKAGLLLLAFMAVVAAEGKTLPNVVMIMADDFGWSDLAAYRRYQGLADPVATPNLDRLVAEGMMFTDAHSPASLCAPTRFSMLTGSNPYRNGAQSGTWMHTDPNAFQKLRKHTTVGDVFQGVGYRTAMFGKLHVGGGSTNWTENMPYFPSKYGFDYSFVVPEGIQSSPYMYFENDRFVKIDPADPLNPSTPGTLDDLVEWGHGYYTNANGISVITDGHEGLGDANWDSSQNGIVNSRKAVAFLDDHFANYADQPFLVYYCAPQMHEPHTPPIDFNPYPDGTPHDPSHPDFVPIRGESGGTWILDVIVDLDAQVSAIVGKLEDPNGDGNTNDSVLAETLIMFTSDNGGLNTLTSFDPGIEGYDTTGGLNGSKSSNWEGGHRVPFVARWGDGTDAGSIIKPGAVSDQIICNHDWVATMYALTGTPMADLDAMDSKNILPLLLGTQPQDEPVRDFLVLQAIFTTWMKNPYIMREDDYVLFMNVTNREPAVFYDLSSDWQQTNNLINEAALQTTISNMHATFLQCDKVNDARSTEVYIAETGTVVWAENFSGSVMLNDDSKAYIDSEFSKGEWIKSGDKTKITAGEELQIRNRESSKTWQKGQTQAAGIVLDEARFFGKAGAYKVSFNFVSATSGTDLGVDVYNAKLGASADNDYFVQTATWNVNSAIVGKDTGSDATVTLLADARFEDATDLGTNTVSFTYNGSGDVVLLFGAERDSTTPGNVVIDDVSVVVENRNPVFGVNPFSTQKAIKDYAYNASIADFAYDMEGQSLTFSIDGPTWLSVSTNGMLSGTPAAANVGLNSFDIQVVDGFGGSASAELQIEVVELDKQFWSEDFSGSVTLNTDGKGYIDSEFSTGEWVKYGSETKVTAGQELQIKNRTSSTTAQKGHTQAASIVLDESVLSHGAGVYMLQADLTFCGTATKLGVDVYDAELGTSGDNDYFLQTATWTVNHAFAGKDVGSDASVTQLATAEFTSVGTKQIVFEYDGSGDVVLLFGAMRTDTVTGAVRIDNLSLMGEATFEVDFAASDIAVLGTVSGSLADGDVNDDTYQTITEVVYGNTSALEHKWVFNVTGSELVTFYLEAHHSANSEGDDFIFSYSTNDVDYIDMVTVGKTADDNTVQYYSLPSQLSGTVYIRVKDADRTDSNTVLDVISVDAQFIVSEESTP